MRIGFDFFRGIARFSLPIDFRRDSLNHRESPGLCPISRRERLTRSSKWKRRKDNSEKSTRLARALREHGK